MTRHVALNNIEHKNLKVIPRYTAEFGAANNCVLTFPTEYGDVQREYPIVFRKDQQTGDYQSIALLGFTKGENLFLDGAGWNASYIPGIIARGPFLIGFQERESDGELRKEPVIHVDLDDPRVNEKEGMALFLRHGGNTPFLQRMALVLRAIHDGMTATKEMFTAFESYGLVEPVNLEVEVHRDEQYNLMGLYTINPGKLNQLDGDALEKLNKPGFLQAAFMVTASLTNMKKLIEMKRRRILETAKQPAEAAAQ
ncbi:MAG TPA: SapC family protein [Gammaproteobacteria bacterium]|nr:SapC family protein [Gammaproteobacteria bacterium]